MKPILEAAPAAIASWEDLARIASERCSDLTFSPDCFDHLHGHPFAPGAAQRVVVLLDTLDRLRRCVDENGRRTADGQRLYQEHFTGDKAWFTDSSDTEKSVFESKLTFRHPTVGGRSLFCSWHGKVKNHQLRIHFTWPVGAREPLYVVYVGPKLIKR
jgi:hypothetical protein